MSLFFQAIACLLVGLVFSVLMNRQGSSVGLLLGITVCVLVMIAAIHYLQPVMELMKQLQQSLYFDQEMLSVMLKAVAIGLITELTALLCADGGNSAMGRAVEILACAVILWLSIPLMNSLLELVLNIAEEL